MGSFGVFWPNRDSFTHPANHIESSYTHFAFCTEGLDLWGTLDTPACSSTRAELIAGIVAICADGPVHIASDSKAFIDGARKYIYIISPTGTKSQFGLISLMGTFGMSFIKPSLTRALAA